MFCSNQQRDSNSISILVDALNPFNCGSEISRNTFVKLLGKSFLNHRERWFSYIVRVGVLELVAVGLCLFYEIVIISHNRFNIFHTNER